MSDLKRTSSIAIDAPAEVVFAILTDPRQHSRIDGSRTVLGNVSGDTDLKMGSKFRMDMKMGVPYKIGNTVVEFEENRLIAWKHMGLHRWRYELNENAGSTEVTETWDLAKYPGPIAKALDNRVGDNIQKSLDRTLVNLKEAAESDATQTASKSP